MESYEGARKYAQRRAKQEGDGTLFAEFLIFRRMLYGYLEMLREQKDELSEKIETYGSHGRYTERFARLQGDLVHILDEIKELESFLGEKAE